MARIEADKMFVIRKPHPEEADRIILQASKNRRVSIVCYFNNGDGTVRRATYNPYLDSVGNIMSNLHGLFNAIQEADAVIVREDRRNIRQG